MMPTGRCSDGADLILTSLECEYAALRLDLDDVTAYPVDRENRPSGCYYYNNKLFFNDAGDPESDDTKRVAICMADDS
jgi:hypothetical protein